MEEIVCSMVNTFLYVLLCKMFVESFAKKKENISLCGMCFILILWAVLDYQASALFYDYFVVKQMVIVLLGTVNIWFCFQTRFIKSGLMVLFYQGICFAADYVAWMGMQKLLITTIQETTMLNFLMGTLSQILVFGFIVVLRHYFIQESVDLFTHFEWAKFSVFPICTIIIDIAMLVNFHGLTNEKQINTLLCIAFGLLILNIFVFYLIREVLEREIRIRKERLLLERAKCETAMYHQISESFDQQKKREHEYKNEMMLIASLLKQKELEKMDTLLGKYNEETAHRIDAIDTNHVIVNAILNAKHQEAKEKGILFVLKVNDLSELDMEDEDIVVILSNMLNNAIEACEKCRGKKIIKVKAVKGEGKVIFSVINTIEEMPQFVDEIYETTKEDKQFHGMGIENVKEIVSRYGGTCAIRHDEGHFYFVVYLSK